MCPDIYNDDKHIALMLMVDQQTAILNEEIAHCNVNRETVVSFEPTIGTQGEFHGIM